MNIVHQLTVAALLLIMTLGLQAAGVTATIEWLRRVVARDVPKFALLRAAGLVMQTAAAIICLHGLIILLWAAFYRLRCFPSWEIAFYFSASSYVTVGYGDVVLPPSWRLLGPLESMTGVLMCGISIGVLVALVTRLVDRTEQPNAKTKVSMPSPVISTTEASFLSEQSRA